MPSNIHQAITEINDISRQLLSCIASAQDAIEESIKTPQEPSSTVKNEAITETDLTKLITRRDQLIKALFGKEKNEDLAHESSLLTQMVTLDKEITTSSQLCKKILTEQVIKVKNSKKVKKTYQQY